MSSCISPAGDAAGGTKLSPAAYRRRRLLLLQDGTGGGRRRFDFAAWRHVYPGNIRDIAFTVSRDGGRTLRNRFASPTINGSWTGVLKMDRRGA